MARGKAWTATEDAIIRENAMFAPSWNGYAILLPGRTEAAIALRRKVLGVQYDNPKAARHRAPKPKAARAEAPRPTMQRRGRIEYETTWSQEEVEALVLHVRDMCAATGHSPAECAVEFGHLVRAYEAGRRG